ncbi:CD177 antigen [Perognathus longimembris pacificus]|uniref:CD177 antigen n=1 Tax=Perognathus longimembris pacificus TaxID=214514 RepID=UPI002018ED08|nr:CD177 antigen [Perognathus longimembris pacificus]
MSPAPLLAVLLATASLPAAQALQCQEGLTQVVRATLELPLNWTAGQETCGAGQGCQDTVMIIANGPKVNIVISKGCTMAEDEEARVTRHRAGPGLSITSYHHVCRHADFCNSLSSTQTLGALPTPSVPGTLRCPVCFSSDHSCPEDSQGHLCPAGHTHCYDGLLRLRGGGITSNLRVQGCLPQPGCNLLNGTQTIGIMDVSESCGPWSERLECQKGALETVRELSELPLQWTCNNCHVTCQVGEGCQDTLVIVENGPQVYLALSKGCTTAQDHEARVTEHRLGPGLSVTSYSLVCRRGDFCNALSSTVPVWAPPPATAPGTLRCPVCFSRGKCPEKLPEHLCPVGHTHCYDGFLRLSGGEISSNLRVQGCLPQPGCNLLNGTQTIGVMDVSESCGPWSDPPTCFRGVSLQSGYGFNPVEWNANGRQMCNAGEVCQETLLLIDIGPNALLVGSKGCGVDRGQASQRISIYSSPPGMLVASYSRFCSSDLCNNANSSSVLLSSLQPGPPVPGDTQCPACVQLSSCSSSSSPVTCPKGATGCYSGSLHFRGGGLFSPLSIQGCVPPNFTSLLKGTQNIGIFSVMESFEIKESKKRKKNFMFSSAALGACRAPVLALGLSLSVLSFSLLANLISL